MEFSTKAVVLDRTLSRSGNDCTVVLVYTQQQLSQAAQALDALCNGEISKAVKSGDISGKPGSTLLLRNLPGISQRLLLVGAGDADKLSRKAVAEALRSTAKALQNTQIKSLGIAPLDAVPGLEPAQLITSAVLALRECQYQFQSLKSEKAPEFALSKVEFWVDKKTERAARLALEQAVAIANGVDLAKDLGNLPGNVCTPSYLANTAKKLGKQFKLKVQVLERKQIEALRMGSFLSVARGSEEPCKFIVLEYNGAAKSAKPVVLVGKGITFDTGGISLKPGAEMDEMKYDMCGAASVLGTLHAVAQMQLPLNVVGLIPATDNMPSGRATKPGDIVTSMSGQTIEVLNTDAEGRLILCDALTYAERYQPQAVVDIATLTGACVVALGAVNSGLFTPDDALADELLQAGRNALDPCWRMPVEDEYQELLKSPFADMANIGGRWAGSVTAACFLARFTKKYDWAHLDIAGTAWKSGANKGATGRPVPLLVEFLRQRAEQKPASP